MSEAKILVTGGGGYIGSVLVRKLLKKGYQVRVLDNFMYGIEPLVEILNHPRFEILKGDIRNDNDLKKAVRKIDNIIHLAAIVGDPASNLRADVTVETNFLATVKLAQLAKKTGVKKFIFTSTCSVYGASNDLIMDEDSPTKPLSLYAETKLKAEKELISLLKGKSKLTILRLGTAYGLSPRMRFDLVVNDLTKKALFEGKIKIFGGKQWRPFVHVSDISQAILLVLETPSQKTGQAIFNVGTDKENYRIIDLGKLIKKIIPKTDVQIIKAIQDRRSYRISFKKIKKELGFVSKKTVKDGILETKEMLESKKIKDPYRAIFYNDQVSPPTLF